MKEYNAIYHFISKRKVDGEKTNDELFQQLIGIINEGRFISYKEIESFGNDILLNKVVLKERYPVCFYDTKLGDRKNLDYHMSKYSKFGIGIERKYVLEEGGNPVLYCYDSNDGRGGTEFYSIFKCLNCYFNSNNSGDNFTNAKNKYEELLKFVKSFNFTDKDVYYENEWRFIAKDEINGKPSGDFVVKKMIKDSRTAILVLIIPKEYKLKLTEEIQKIFNKIKKPKIITAEELLKAKGN